MVRGRGGQGLDDLLLLLLILISYPQVFRGFRKTIRFLLAKSRRIISQIFDLCLSVSICG